ncbi:hypothetical protein N9230_01960 [Akkermansiaceae bacterium]|nr:hypothetical protein [Akkermansiaceae bacterium]
MMSRVRPKARKRPVKSVENPTRKKANRMRKPKIIFETDSKPSKVPKRRPQRQSKGKMRKVEPKMAKNPG